MKKVRSVINIVLGAIISALGLSSCEELLVAKYGVPEVLYGPDPYVTAEKYGVPYDEWSDEDLTDTQIDVVDE